MFLPAPIVVFVRGPLRLKRELVNGFLPAGFTQRNAAGGVLPCVLTLARNLESG